MQVMRDESTLHMKHVRVLSRFLQFRCSSGLCKGWQGCGHVIVTVVQQDRQIVQRISPLGLVGGKMWQKSRNVGLFGVWASIGSSAGSLFARNVDGFMCTRSCEFNAHLSIGLAQNISSGTGVNDGFDVGTMV